MNPGRLTRALRDRTVLDMGQPVALSVPQAGDNTDSAPKSPTTTTTVDAARIAALRQLFPGLDLDPLAVGLAIRHASVAIDRSLADQLRPWGLTPVALQALIALYLSTERPLRLNELGAELRVTKANVSLVLAGLERQKLIRRSADPGDGRRIQASVTAAGAKALEKIMPEAIMAMENALVHLSRAQRDQIRVLALDIS
jgi:DNA-binding MarR family transcriptional regulator